MKRELRAAAHFAPPPRGVSAKRGEKHGSGAREREPEPGNMDVKQRRAVAYRNQKTNKTAKHSRETRRCMLD
jgi:hypothetical protein